MGFMSDENWERWVCECKDLKVCVSCPGCFGEICNRPVWQDTHCAYSVSFFMEFGLGKASVYKPHPSSSPPPTKKKNTGQTSGFCLQQVVYREKGVLMSLICHRY